MIDVKTLVRTLTPILTAVALSLVGAAQVALPKITGIAEEHGSAINEHAALLDELTKRTAECREASARLEASMKGVPAETLPVTLPKPAARVKVPAESVDEKTASDAGPAVEESSKP